jgi:hypothetical protein
MARPQVFEGTLDEIQDRLRELRGNPRLTLIISEEADKVAQPMLLHHATPEERARALNEIAEMNRGLPVLPAEAFRRYARIITIVEPQHVRSEAV